MRATMAMALLMAGCAAAQQPQNRLEITIEQRTPEGWQRADPATVFASGDRLRFRVKSNFRGFLYVMNLGTSGNYTLLFPREDTGSENRLEPEQEVVVPSTDGAFTITGPEGYDIVYWMITPVAVASGQRRPGYVPLPPAPPAGTKLDTLRPRCDDTVFKARGECIDRQAGPRKVAAIEALPQNLKSIPGLKSRELVFIKEGGTSVVSSPPGLSGPVVYEFRVAHK